MPSAGDAPVSRGTPVARPRAGSAPPRGAPDPHWRVLQARSWTTHPTLEVSAAKYLLLNCDSGYCTICVYVIRSQGFLNP